MNSMVPMLLAPTEVPRGHQRLLGQAGAWKVFATDYALRDAELGYSVVQPLEGEVAAETTEGFQSFHTSVTFAAVSLTPRLFRHEGRLVALLVPEQTETVEVLDVAREVFGDVEPLEGGP